jgi:hypothetical protein
MSTSSACFQRYRIGCTCARLTTACSMAARCLAASATCGPRAPPPLSRRGPCGACMRADGLWLGLGSPGLRGRGPFAADPAAQAALRAAVAGSCRRAARGPPPRPPRSPACAPPTRPVR